MDYIGLTLHIQPVQTEHVNPLRYAMLWFLKNTDTHRACPEPKNTGERRKLGST